MKNTRTFQIDNTRASDGGIPVVLSTETPVWRDDMGAYEVLDHSSLDNVDLSRAPIPVIESHDSHTLNIGIVTDLKVVGKKLRGVLKLGSSSRAKEVAQDIADGIVRNVSIGYQILKHTLEGETVRVMKFAVNELSLVSVPADPASGLYRSYDMSDDNVIDVENTRRGKARARDAAKAEVDRIEGIRAIANIHNREETIAAGEAAIADGSTIELARIRILNSLTSEPLGGGISPADYDAAGKTYSSKRGIHKAQTQKYSITNAIRALVEPNFKGGGYEREISQEMEQQRGRSAQGLIIPFGEMTRVLTGAGGASDLIGTDHLYGSFIDILRSKSITLALGATVLDGLNQNVSIPRQSASATGEWLDLDGTSAITPSDPTFDNVSLTMKTVAGLTTMSHRALKQGLPGVDALVSSDLAKVLATALDVAALTGIESATVPGGILTSITPTVYTPPPALGDIVDLEGTVAGADALEGSLAYATTPAVMSTLKQTPVDAGSGSMIWTGSLEGSMMNGYRAVASSNMPLNNVLFGDWSSVLVGFWGSGVELNTDEYSEFSKGNVSIRAILDVDVALRHLESFAAIAPA